MSFPDILLIEDNSHDVEMILDTFRAQNISNTVCVLRNGAEALDFFFSPRGCLQNADFHCPRFILLDLKLPKVEGLEVLRRLKSDERTKNIPTIIFSSSDEARDRIESYLWGANSYIVKPLDADSFSRAAADIASYWLSMNRTSYQDR